MVVIFIIFPQGPMHSQMSKVFKGPTDFQDVTICYQTNSQVDGWLYPISHAMGSSGNSSGSDPCWVFRDCFGGYLIWGRDSWPPIWMLWYQSFLQLLV